MMRLLNLVHKLQRRLWSKIVGGFRDKSYYPIIYRSYWHYRLTSKNDQENNIGYYTAVPNPGAGIGHQLANWIAGYWFARQLGLKFAHTPFASKSWESFLGLGKNEIRIEQLLSQGYKKVLLPLFNEFNPDEVELIKKIIQSYANQRVVFVAEQDQFYQDQFGVMEDIKSKFYNADARKHDRLIYSHDNFNIAIHVRRGDIVAGKNDNNLNMLIRWLDNEYFERVLATVVEHIPSHKPYAIYLFSQGCEQDFPEFNKFNNLHFCLDMNAQDSFLHMVYADLLITSKSSFSYKPALFSNGIKICPKNFWHGYPRTNDWILSDDHGVFNVNQLRNN